jgi:hypothetical protein
VIEEEVTPTIFFPPIKIESASLRKRLPPQSKQGFSDQILSVPKPLQVWQAPYGLLKENKRGSISGKEKPSSGQVNLADKETS